MKYRIKIFHCALILLLHPLLMHGQLSDELLNNIQQATNKYYFTQDTVDITCSPTLPCLKTYINGSGPYNFLIDLGSNVCVFAERVVKEAGVDVLIDRERGDIVKADKINIGNNVFLDVHAAAYKSLDVDGVIGYNLLSKTSFFMDYPNMSFGVISGFPDTLLNQWTPFEVYGRMPYLRESVGERETYISFDTGADLWLYFPYHWKDSVTFEIPLKKFKEMTNNQTGTVMTYIGKIKEDVSFGNYMISSPYVIFDPDIEDMYVGSSLLSQFKLTFFPGEKRVHMYRKDKGNQLIIPENQKEVGQ